MSPGRKRRERPHRPAELGPRLYRRGRWWAADLRPWQGPRLTLRDPSHPGWPEAGERTEDMRVAEAWKWVYVEHYADAIRRRHLGLPPVGRSLGRAAEEWLAMREETKAEATWKNNTAALNRIIERFGADMPVRRIGAADLQRMFSELLRDGYAPSSLHTERTILGTFFRWAGEDHNPAKDIALPDVPERDIFTWTDDELEKIRTAATSVDAQRQRAPSARLAVELALATGARQQELFALEWTAFNADARTVRITRQLSKLGKRFMPLKGKMARTALVLPSWWEWHVPDAAWLILANEDGSPYDYRAATALVQRVLDTAGLNGPGHGWHDFRRTYGRLFLEAGGWMDELQRSLGHKSIRTTEKSYGHFAQDRAAEFARARIYGEGRLRVMP